MLTTTPMIEPEHVAEALARIAAGLAIYFRESPALTHEDRRVLALARVTDPDANAAMEGMERSAGVGGETSREFTRIYRDLMAELDALDIDDERAMRDTAAWFGLMVGATAARLAADQESD